jgi:hypothetical protein
VTKESLTQRRKTPRKKRKKSLGYVLATPDGSRWWAGNGTLPVGTVRPGKVPLPLFGQADALRAARALRDVLGLELRPTALFAPGTQVRR